MREKFSLISHGTSHPKYYLLLNSLFLTLTIKIYWLFLNRKIKLSQSNSSKEYSPLNRIKFYSISNLHANTEYTTAWARCRNNSYLLVLSSLETSQSCPLQLSVMFSFLHRLNFSWSLLYSSLLSASDFWHQWPLHWAWLSILSYLTWLFYLWIWSLIFYLFLLLQNKILSLIFFFYIIQNEIVDILNKCPIIHFLRQQQQIN